MNDHNQRNAAPLFAPGDRPDRRPREDSQSAPRYTGIPTFFRTAHLSAPSDWAGVDIALVGVPYDGGTTNRPGARHGPRSLREASTMIAPWNPALDINPFQLCRVADVGDAWARHPFHLESSLTEIGCFFQALCAAGPMPLSAGGDHSVSLPILRALGADSPVGMVHIDAHCDTGDGYMGSRYHHGAPFARAVEEGVLDPQRTVQIGIRGPLNGDLWRFSREHGMRVFSMDECVERGLNAVVDEARSIVGDGPCYISFDIDALDPAYAPGTGTPVVGGFTSREALGLVRGMRGLDLVGADVVEVSPPFDVSCLTALTGATVMFELLCLLAEVRAAWAGGQG